VGKDIVVVETKDACSDSRDCLWFGEDEAGSCISFVAVSDRYEWGKIWRRRWIQG
jgi:hypothetical protein